MNNKVTLEPIKINGMWRAWYCEGDSMCMFILEEGSLKSVEFESKQLINEFIVYYKEKWGIR